MQAIEEPFARSKQRSDGTCQRHRDEILTLMRRPPPFKRGRFPVAFGGLSEVLVGLNRASGRENETASFSLISMLNLMTPRSALGATVRPGGVDHAVLETQMERGWAALAPLHSRPLPSLPGAPVCARPFSQPGADGVDRRRGRRASGAPLAAGPGRLALPCLHARRRNAGS